MTQYCSAGVKFFRVLLSLNFAGLSTIPAATNMLLCREYYIQLLQFTVQLTSTAGSQYNLSTFQGPSDILTLLLKEFQRKILDMTHQPQSLTYHLAAPTAPGYVTNLRQWSPSSRQIQFMISCFPSLFQGTLLNPILCLATFIRSSPMSLTALEFSCFNLLGHVRDC